MKLAQVVILFAVFLTPGWCFSTEVRTAAQNSFPKFYLDANNTMRGMLPEIIEEIMTIDPSIKIVGYEEFVPLKRAEEWMQKGAIDIFFGLTRSEKRKAQYVFPEKPLYQVQHVVAVRANDSVQVATFDDLRQLKENNTILTLYQTATYRFLLKQGGLKVDQRNRDVESILEKLVLSRGRFAYYHSLGLVSTIRKLNLEEKVRILPGSFRDYHHWHLYSQKVPESTRKQIDRAVQHMRETGRLQEITDKYLKFN